MALTWLSRSVTEYSAFRVLTILKGIVFASYNYRLSLFGYPHALEIAERGETQNFGLLDTRAAVRWLYENVVEFGGDPNKITLGGG
jgi:carboxylesterase type B